MSNAVNPLLSPLSEKSSLSPIRPPPPYPFQGKKINKPPLSFKPLPLPSPPHYYSSLINDRLYQSIMPVKLSVD